MSVRIATLAFLAGALATPLNLVQHGVCNPCNPHGATGSHTPSVGPDLSSFYLDILASVKDIHFKRSQANAVQARDDGFCCAETLDCVNVQNLNIPMCYDKFTTNFAFADRSYGSLTTGEYVQGDAQANLLTGQYSNGGKEGNVYSDDPEAKPNTATLSIPPQWTEAGVGSAIPPTAIVGSVAAPAETSARVSAQTTMSSSAEEQSSSRTSATTASAASQSIASSTASASRSTESSTPSDQVSEAASPTSSQGAAAQGIQLPGTSLAMSIFTALMYAVRAL